MKYLKELRAQFFTASIIPVLLGSCIALKMTGEFHLLYFLATLIGGVLLHAGANVANDYFDYRNGTDNINKDYTRPFTGGSRMIQHGIMTPGEVLAESLICYLLAIMIGVWLIHELGLTILWLGLIGIISGFFYVAPPFKFVSRGLGEIIIGLNFGVLMTIGSYFVQTRRLSWLPIFASIPVAILITAVLYINEFPDYQADKDSGKLHLVARLGRKKAAFLFQAMLLLTYLSIIAGVIFEYIPFSGLITLITLPLAIKAFKISRIQFDDPKKIVPANITTIQLHLFIGLILSATYIISGLLIARSP